MGNCMSAVKLAVKSHAITHGERSKTIRHKGGDLKRITTLISSKASVKAVRICVLAAN